VPASVPAALKGYVTLSGIRTSVFADCGLERVAAVSGVTGGTGRGHRTDADAIAWLPVGRALADFGDDSGYLVTDRDRPLGEDDSRPSDSISPTSE
jgi:hypothetical protein